MGVEGRAAIDHFNTEIHIARPPFSVTPQRINPSSISVSIHPLKPRAITRFMVPKIFKLIKLGEV